MIRAILFDKDGTLLNFEKTWIPVVEKVVKKIMGRYELADAKINRDLHLAIGIDGDYLDPKGPMGQGTNKDIAEGFMKALEMHNVIIEDKEGFIDYSTNLFDSTALSSRMYPIVDNMRDLFIELKKKDFLLGIVTSDTDVSTANCLKELEIFEYIDFIGSDDGILPPKPNPGMMEAFCKEFSVQPEEVAVVGDTPTDMNFGMESRAGVIIGVLSGTSGKDVLDGKADIIIDSIMDIIDESGTLIWEKRKGAI